MPSCVRIVVGITLLAGSVASAQTPVNNGRALDRDLRVGGGGVPTRPDFAAEVRLRNAIVTGNAPGGKSFRGSVGYSDASDFRDRLGSDDLYGFRRDSLMSGLGGQGMRGTEGLQYQFGFATGAGFRQQTDFTVSRFGEVATARDLRAGAAQRNYASPSWGFNATPNGSLRSTASYTANRTLSPVVLGVREADDGTKVTRASSLLGVRTYGYRPEPLPGQVATPDAAEPGAITPRREGETETRRPNEVRAESAAAVRAAPSAQGQRVRTAMDDLRQRLEADTTEKPATPGAPTQPDTGTKTPGTKTPGTTPKPTAPETPGTPGTSRTPGVPGSEPGVDPNARSAWERRMEEIKNALQPSPRRERKIPEAKTPEEQKDRDRAEASERFAKSKERIDKDIARQIRRAGQLKTNTFVPEVPAWRDVYVEQMQAAEKLMGEGKYFDAEERFARALSARGGDTNAMAGRINAQIASGLFVSAATNIRMLAQAAPETLGMRYGPKLLPTDARQVELIAQLRKNIVPTSQREGGIEWRVPKESALLLAYLGYQRGSSEVVREGLQALRRENVRPTPEDLAWMDLLEGVWIED